MAKLTIDLSGIKGLAPRFWGDIDRTSANPEWRILGTDGQMADGIYNPFRRYGYISPANATFADLTFTGGTYDALMTSSIYDILSNDYYFAEAGQQIFKGDGLDDTELTRVLDLGAGDPVIMDLEMYQLNGVRKLFYIYKKSGKMEIGEANLPFASANNNWLTADVVGAFTNDLTNNAFMRVANNGFAYIFQDNNIHKLDGTATGGDNGTISPNAIQFPGFYQAIDAIDYRGNMFVVVRQDQHASRAHTKSVFSSIIGVYIWDRKTSIVSVSDYIPLNGVKYIRKIYIGPRGDLRIICVNSERVVEIRRFNGSTFEIIEEAGIGADFVRADGLVVVSNFVIWVGQDGNIYAHGRVTHRDKEAIYKIGNISDVRTLGVPVGALLFGGEDTDDPSNTFKTTKNGLFIPYTNSSGSLKLKEWDIYGTGGDGVTAQMNKGNIYTLVKYLPRLSTVNSLDIYMIPGSGSGSTIVGTVKIYFNQSSTPWASKTITRDENARGYKSIEISKPYINSIQLEIEYPTNVTIGLEDFAPSIAIVDYTSTRTRG